MGAELAKRLLDHDRAAVSEALNLLDDRRPERREEALALLEALEQAGAGENTPRVGLTGAPGSGKSTLLDALVRALRERGRTVGIIAVDPSSRRSGGALLGDRFRVRAGAGDPGVYLRSMAARDRLGGLADAAWAGATVLGAVFDHVFVETVGVGQSESDVAGLVDTLVFVAQPGAGDVLQFMKAGVLELPDVVVVNKADVGAPAERAVHELRAGLGLGGGAEAGWERPVLLASARDGRGVDAVVDALDAHHAFLSSSGEGARRRRRARERLCVDALVHRYGTYGVDALGGRDAVAARVHEATDRSAFALLRDLGHEVEDVLRKPS